MTKQSFVEFKVIDRYIALIKISRPEVLNALDREVAAELIIALDTASVDEKIKIIIVTGDGERSFCAGGDIRHVFNIDPIKAETYSTYMHDILNKIENLEKPVIAAINGFALGGGCQLAMACDIRIASSNAKMGQTEVTMGITPGWGGTQRLSRIVGQAIAKELIFTGKIITAEEAERIGLVNKIVMLTQEEELNITTDSRQSSSCSDSVKSSVKMQKNHQGQDDEQYMVEQIQKQKAKKIAKVLNKKLLNECISVAKNISKNSFVAVRTSKVLINKGMDADIDTGLRLEIYGMAYCFGNEDRQKRMTAFLNKEKNKES